ncbi:MAG: hypothetical protein IJK56_11000 [Firmicutes bacterium]|nr:hypothetical protein [Bacillota bacterium]
MADYTFSKTGAAINEILGRFTTPDADTIEAGTNFVMRSWPTVRSLAAYGSGINFALQDGVEPNAIYARVFQFPTNNCGRIFLRQMSGTENGMTGFYEDYVLPTCDAGMTANRTYFLLSTKETVTIAQGGTGATSAKSALDSIGGRYIFPGISIQPGESTTISIGTNTLWKSCLILGTITGSGGSIIGVRFNDGAVVAAKNLITGADWSNPGLEITGSGDNVTLANNAASGGTNITVYAG